MAHKVIVNATQSPPSYLIKEDKHYVSLDERRLAKQIPGYKDMTANARERHFKKWLDSEAKIVCRAELDWQPNIHKRDRVPVDGLPAGAQTFLSGTQVIQDPSVGYRLFADILMGQHMTALRKTAPSLCAMTSVTSDSPEIEQTLSAIVEAAVPRNHWSGKHCKLKRSAILDYRSPGSVAPLHIQDHSALKLIHKGKRKAKVPFPYTDTATLVIGASSAQLHEAGPYLANASVILLNSSAKGMTPTNFPRSSVAGYDPEIVERFRRSKLEVATMLNWWWLCFEDEEAWAEQIVQRARAAFGKPDSRYIRVELDPAKLRDAIRYQVFLSFLDELECEGIMTADEQGPYRQGAKEVFDPAPPEVVHIRQADDPEVFLEVVKELMEDPPAPIIAEEAAYVKKGKHLAAWRTISQKRFLVFEEAVWAEHYKKSVRRKKDIDMSLFQKDKWEQLVQKRLCEERIIKSPGAGSRYRYDLFGNGTRDQTYVVAVYADRLS